MGASFKRLLISEPIVRKQNENNNIEFNKYEKNAITLKRILY